MGWEEGAGLLGKGLSAGVDTYLKARELDEDRDYKRKHLAALLAQHGLQEGPDGLIGKTASQLESEKRKNAQDQAELEYKRLQGKKLAAELSGGGAAGGGKTLPAQETANLAGATSSVKQLDDYMNSLAQAEDITGPFMGRVSGLMAKAQLGDTGQRAASLDAMQRQLGQVIGTYLEKGKLTDADVPKYIRMLPAMTDSPQVRRAKTESLKRLIATRQADERNTLGAAGYDVEKIPASVGPELPSMAAKSKGFLGGEQGTATAGASKPKTVRQNGHTFTLNPQTGEYE